MALISVVSKFHFYQQIRVLMRKLRDGSTPDAVLLDEKIQISSSLSLDSPNGQVDNIRQEAPDSPVEVTVWHNGLTGAMGALPTAYTEWMIERQYRYGDRSAKAFIDLFGHRLYCLDYLAWQKYHLSALAESQEQLPLQTEILALTGRLSGAVLPEQIHNAVFFSSPVRSMANLEGLLNQMFGIPAKIIPFTGGWQPVAVEERCQLGDTRQTIAIAPMLGSVRLELHSHFDVILGPMSPAVSCRFTQSGSVRSAVWKCIRDYVGPVLDFTISLSISSVGLAPIPLGKGALGLDLCLGHNRESYLRQVRLPTPTF